MDHLSETINRIRANFERNRASQASTAPSLPNCAESSPPLANIDPWLGLELTHPALMLAKRRVAEFANRQRLGLVLMGNYGCGKTHLGRVVFRHFFTQCLMIGEPMLLERLHAAYGGDGSEALIVSELRLIPVLVLDDVGAGYVTPESKAWIEGLYWRVLDRRAEHQLPVMITCNLHVEQLAERLGGRAMSRLVGLCGSDDSFVDLSDVPDYRCRNLSVCAQTSGSEP